MPPRQTPLNSRANLEREVYEVIQKIKYSKRTINDFYAGILAVIFMTAIANFLETYGLDSLVVFYRKPVSTVLDNLERNLEEYRAPLLHLEKATKKASSACPTGSTLEQCQRFLLKTTDSGSNEEMRDNYEDLLDLYKTLVTAVTKAGQLPAGGVKSVLEKLPDNFSAADIYEAYAKLINATEHFLKSLRNQGFIDFAAKNLVLNATNIPLIVANVVSFSSGQFLIFSPLVNYFCPHGIGQSPIPMNKTPLALMSQEQLQRYFNKLEKHHQLVSASAGRYKKFSRALTALVLSYTAMAYFFELKMNYAFLVLLLGFLATALSGAYREAKEWNDSRVLTKRLDVQSTQLTEMMPNNTNGVIETNDGERLETSSFTIKLTGSYSNLSPKILKRIVRVALTRFGDKIIAEDKTSITITAGNYLNKKRATERQQYISDYIKRVGSLDELRTQLRRIDGCIIVSGYDEKRLPIITADFVVSKDLVETFKNIFPALEFAQSAPDEKDKVAISLRGYEPGNKELLQNWLQQKQIASTITADLSNPAPVSTTALTSVSITAPVTTTSAEKKPKRWHSLEATPLQAQTPVQKGQTISWKLSKNHTVIYDPEKGDEVKQEVRPIEGLVGQFGIFAVPRNRVSRNKHDDGVYEKFHGQFSERLKAVPSEGQQGVKICGKEEDGSAKLKVLGDYGAWRVFAHAVRSPTGQTLHVFDDVRRVHT